MPSPDPPTAPDTPSDIIHHIAFDTPGRPQLWKPVMGRAWSVQILPPRFDVEPDRYGDFDPLQIEDILQAITRVSGGDVGWVWANRTGRPAEITLQVVPFFDFDHAFRGGVCWPTVTAGLLIGARLEWTPWDLGRELFWGSGAHELAHGMLGFGHTADRTSDHIMGSARWDQRDFSVEEYAAWEYMRPLPPGALNPRMIGDGGPHFFSVFPRREMIQCPS